MAMIGSISGHQIRRWEPNLFASGGYAYDAERVSNFLYNDFRSGVVDTLKVSGVLKSAGAPPADSLRMQNKPFANTTSTTPFVSDSGSATIWWGDGKSETVAEGSQATHT